MLHAHLGGSETGVADGSYSSSWNVEIARQLRRGRLSLPKSWIVRWSSDLLSEMRPVAAVSGTRFYFTIQVTCFIFFMDSWGRGFTIRLDFYSELETRELVSKLVGNLRAAKRYNEAASLCEHHLKDYQQSGQCLIENLCFSEAWALTNKYQMKEWAGKNISFFFFLFPLSSIY